MRANAAMLLVAFTLLPHAVAYYNASLMRIIVIAGASSFRLEAACVQRRLR